MGVGEALTVSDGVGLAEGEALVMAVGVGVDVGVGVGAVLIVTPLLQTNFLPDLMQVNLFP